MTAPVNSPAPVKAAHPGVDAPAGDAGAPPDAFAALLAGVVAAPATPPSESGTTVPDHTPGTTGPRTPVLDAPPGWPPTRLPQALVPGRPVTPAGTAPDVPVIPGAAPTPVTTTTVTASTLPPAPARPADPAGPVPARAGSTVVPTLTTTAAPDPGAEQVVRTAPVHAEHGRVPEPGHHRLRPQELDVPRRTADGPVPTGLTPVNPVAAPEPLAAPTAPTGTAAVGETGATRHVRPAIVEAARHLRSEGGRTSLVVRLDPPELGAVLVRLTVKDGQVDVQLRTPDLAARSDLQAQSFDVQQVLREQGLDLSSFDVAHGDVLGNPTGSSQPQGGRQTPDRATPRTSGGADGPATTAVVMDDVPSPQPAGTWL